MEYFEDKDTEKRIKDLISDFFNNPQLQKKYTSSKLKSEWKSIVGNFIASRTVNLYVKNQVLFLQLNSSALKNEIMILKTDLISRINEHIGEDHIKDIKIS